MEVFEPAFFKYFEIIITAILIYAVVFALLRKFQVLGDNSKIDAIVALVSALIVSTTGVAAYVISYAVNWFVIIFIILFLIVVILLFLGMDFDTIAQQTKGNSKIVIATLIILFGFIFVQGYFALSNVFDTTNGTDDPYEVNATADTGFWDSTTDTVSNWFDNANIELFGMVLFLLILGIAMIYIGK